MGGKGQYTIIFETVLILVGILITGFVVSNFGSVQAATTNITVEDNFNTVANHVLIGLVKASVNPGYTTKIDIPETIAGETYKIALKDDKITVSMLDSSVRIEKQILNIDKNQRITEGQVASSAGTIEIINENDVIRIRRG